jgi:hypothetical protein
MSKWFFAIFIALVSFLAMGQVDVTPVESGDAISGLFGLISKLMVGKPAIAVIGLVIAQGLILILRTNWLDKAVGNLKMTIILCVAVFIPAITIFISTPKASFSDIFADGATLAALQIAGHQIYLHYFGSKATKV